MSTDDTCIGCGYSLRGHTGDPIRCPECGRLYGPEERRRWQDWNRPFSAREQKRSGVLAGFTGCSLAVAILIAVPVELRTRAIALAGVFAFFAAMLVVFSRYAKGRWSVLGPVAYSFMTATHILSVFALIIIVGNTNKALWQALHVKSTYLPMIGRIALDMLALGAYAVIFRHLLGICLVMAVWIMSGEDSETEADCSREGESRP